MGPGGALLDPLGFGGSRDVGQAQAVKTVPPSVPAAALHRAAVGLRDRRHDGKAQAGAAAAARSRRVGPEEPFEDPCAVLGAQAGATRPRR